MKVKWITVKGRVEIFRLKLQGKIVVGSRKIRPDLDRAAKKQNGKGFDEQSCSSDLDYMIS